MKRANGTEITNKLRWMVERVEYWEYVLGFTLHDLGDDWLKVDEYVKEHYADKLKEPEVMARILGGKNQ